MNAEIVARNRHTGEIRKIKGILPKNDMRKILNLIAEIAENEAVIEIRINSEILM